MLEFLDRIVAKFSPDLGIDFGCSELGVVECGKNSWREPSRLTYDIRHDKVTAVGAKSKLMEGRTSRNESVVRPIQRGCVCDYTGTLELLRFVLGRASQMGIWGPRVMLAVPVDVSEVEERVLADLCRFAGARDIYMVPALLASALGAGLNVTGSKACMVLNMGAEITQAAVLCMGGIVAAASIPLGGLDLDKQIADYCRARHGLVVGLRSAEFLKITGGCARTDKGGEEWDIKGRDLKTGFPRRLKLTAAQIVKVLAPKLEQVAQLIQRVLQNTPPGFAGDIVESGLTLCGGSSQLKELDHYLSEMTGVFCQVAENPATCTLKGLEQMYYDPRIMKTIMAGGLRLNSYVGVAGGI